MEPGRRENLPPFQMAPSERSLGEGLAVERPSSNAEVARSPEAQQKIPGETIAPPPQVVFARDQNVVSRQTSSQQGGLAQQPLDDATMVANDDDLIEKEWVDRTKKVILETKDDPYRREIEIEKLQIEYIRKRYGREIGTSDN